MSYKSLKNPIFVALDVDDLVTLRNVVETTYDLVGGFKIGPRTVFRFGPSLVREISEKAPVFLDFKFYDIPSTMEASVKSAFEMGATFCTIHAGSGRKALSSLANVELELSSQRAFHILAVTILTSFDAQNLPSHFLQKSIAEHVSLLVEESLENGIKNFVCSPHELQTLKNKYSNAKFVTPGIRLQSGQDDQVRTATYAEALKLGASAVVIGRPVLAAPNPRAFIQSLIASS